jgi:hypothetical protein
MWIAAAAAATTATTATAAAIIESYGNTIFNKSIKEASSSFNYQ